MLHNKYQSISAAILAALSVSAPASAETLTQFLRAFHKNPARMMERLPSVVDKKGVAHPQGYIDQSFIDESFPYRMEIREKITGGETEAPPGDRDNVANLVDKGTVIERNIAAMDAMGLTTAVSTAKPWADSYWPTYRGQVGYRYSDPKVPKTKDWFTYYDYFMSNPASSIVASGDPTLIDMLSPSEKYDYVMGDANFTLSAFAWSEGQRQAGDGGRVPTWMGICHGWSAAAHMDMPFIGKPVRVRAPDGTPVTFYPQDIKALLSMLWANASPRARFLGNRCYVSKPARNANGRIVDPACFDTNPATWHLAVVNQMGRNHRSFVFNATFGQVWNFPLRSAHYRYFNPQTLQETASWAEAAVPIESFALDKFREFRSPDTRFVIGIAMDTTYVIEVEPSRSNVFSAPAKTVRYVYDLELDANKNVIGGEWYSNAHPDFLWTYDPKAQARAYGEGAIMNDPWSNNGPVPSHWSAYAQAASARGAPLSAFLAKLINAAGPVHQP